MHGIIHNAESTSNHKPWKFHKYHVSRKILRQFISNIASKRNAYLASLNIPNMENWVKMSHGILSQFNYIPSTWNVKNIMWSLGNGFLSTTSLEKKTLIINGSGHLEVSLLLSVVLHLYFRTYWIKEHSRMLVKSSYHEEKQIREQHYQGVGKTCRNEQILDHLSSKSLCWNVDSHMQTHFSFCSFCSLFKSLLVRLFISLYFFYSSMKVLKMAARLVGQCSAPPNSRLNYQ